MHCPSLNLFGTFFPAWMLCALVGIVAAVAARPLLVALELEPHHKPRRLAYPSLALSVTFAVWLVWFGH